MFVTNPETPSVTVNGELTKLLYMKEHKKKVSLLIVRSKTGIISMCPVKVF